MTEPLFPLFLRLSGRKVVLVGGGKVATGKFAALQEAEARITVVAPRISDELRALCGPEVVLHERVFAASDLEGAWLVVAAAPGAVNREVAAAAEARGLFVNAVDDRAAASAFAGGVIRRGEVTVAVSTAGGAPALAGLLREALEEVLPPEVADWALEARRLRDEWRARAVPPAMEDRRPLLFEMLAARYRRGGK